MTATEARTDWETVIGLEVHVELATATKMFCGCPNTFGSEPNTNVCPVCLGLPGSLPVVNELAVELAAALGLALGCDVRPSVFARKNYFYPDMPRTTRSAVRLLAERRGRAGAAVRKRIGITVSTRGGHRQVHSTWATAAASTAPRPASSTTTAGVPLLEIVSEPDPARREEAFASTSSWRSIILAVGASDAKMEEGSMRVDANVSVHRPGDPFGTRRDQEPQSPAAVARPRHRDHAADRPAGGGRDRRAGNPALGRGGRTPGAAQGGCRRLPVLPGARSRRSIPRGRGSTSPRHPGIARRPPGRPRRGRWCRADRGRRRPAGAAPGRPRPGGHRARGPTPAGC